MALRIWILAASLSGLAVPALAQPVVTQPMQVNVSLGPMSDGNAVLINSFTAGSGVLGPQTANHGITLNCQKAADWWDATSTGEIDCVNVVVRQSGPGDSSAIQVNTENLGGGFLAVNESAASSVDKASNTVTHAIDIQEGVVNVGRDVYGYVATNVTGQGSVAFLGQSQNGTAMTSLLQGINNGAQFYRVDWSGNSTQAGSMQPGTVTTTKLPAGCAAGQLLYDSDGRKAGEAASTGWGVPVICTATRMGGATAWFSLWGGAPVQQ